MICLGLAHINVFLIYFYYGFWWIRSPRRGRTSAFKPFRHLKTRYRGQKIYLSLSKQRGGGSVAFAPLPRTHSSPVLGLQFCLMQDSPYRFNILDHSRIRLRKWFPNTSDFLTLHITSNLIEPYICNKKLMVSWKLFIRHILYNVIFKSA